MVGEMKAIWAGDGYSMQMFAAKVSDGWSLESLSIVLSSSLVIGLHYLDSSFRGLVAVSTPLGLGRSFHFA